MTENSLRKLIREEVSKVLSPLIKELGVIIAESRQQSASNVIYGSEEKRYTPDTNDLRQKLGLKNNTRPNNPIEETSSGEKYASGKSILEWYGNGNNVDPQIQELKQKGDKIDDYINGLLGK